MSVVGFDLGDVKGCVALARRGGIDVLLNRESKRETPSVVSFGAKQRVMGTEGLSSQPMNIRNTVYGLKRLVGARFADPAVQAEIARLPFKVGEAPGGGCQVEVQHMGEPAQFTVERVVAMLLTELKGIAEGEMGGAKVTDCVVSIPAYFTDKQRAAMLDATRIAGLNCLRLMHETTATALAYGIYKTELPEKDPLTVVFVDIGHTALQCCVVALKKGQLRVLSQAWDPAVGGRNFDDLLFNHFADFIQDKYRLDVRSNARASLRLRTELTKAKSVLSSNPKANVAIECLMEDTDIQGEITRADFEEMAQPLLKQVLAPCEKALGEAGLTVADVGGLEVVGCGSRIPAVSRLLGEYFGKEAGRTLNAAEVVSRGCALQCAMLSPVFKVREFDVQDAYPYNVCFAWEKPQDAAVDAAPETVSSIVFPKNNVVPSAKMLTFYRSEAFNFEASYGEGEVLPAGLAGDAKIASCTVGPIQVPETSEDGKAKVKVKVALDIHGLVRVEGAQVLEEYEVEVPQVEEPKADEAAGAAAENGGGEAKAENGESAPAENSGSPPAENGDAPAAMETDAAAPAPQKKKKVRRTDTEVNARGSSLPLQELEAYINQENHMRAKDKLSEDTKQARNDLEGYILSARSNLYADWEAFVAEDARASFSKTLEDTEEWMYEDGEDETREVYVAKMRELQGVGDPIQERCAEDRSRGPACAALRESCARCKAMAHSDEEKYSHISAEDRAKVEAECDRALTWLDEKEALQAGMQKTDAPILLSCEVKKKQEVVERVCNMNMFKPKPPPPKEPEKPEEEAPAAGEEQPMETGDGKADAAPMDEGK